MNAKFIVTFLCVILMWKTVSSQQKCNTVQYCNLNNCMSSPPDTDDENKLDRACISNKCNFNPKMPNRRRICVTASVCTEGQYCSLGCQLSPSNGPENGYCKVGLNCNNITLRCDKKPQCKDGEYCKRGDCEGDEKPTVADDDACEAGSECNASFKCIKKPTAEKEDKNGSKWWMWFIIGSVIIGLLVFAICGSLCFFLCDKKNKKKFIKENKIRVSTVNEVTEEIPTVSTVKEVNEEKPTVSTINEAKEVAKKLNSKAAAQKLTHSTPQKSDSKSPYFEKETHKSTISKRRHLQDRKKILKELGEW